MRRIIFIDLGMVRSIRLDEFLVVCGMWYVGWWMVDGGWWMLGVICLLGVMM